MKRFWSIFLCLSLVLPMVAQEEELCIDGTLLFREDFGGNDPSDPDISMASVQGMDPSYHNSGNSLGSGNYTLRKEGWHNGIQWHWQDDHTYFGDKTRGYLLEVDGVGGAKPFYSKTIEGLCAGTQLTFSAYIVNVHYAGQLDYFGSRYVYPRMKFVLMDPETGSILAEKSTGDIQPDWRYGTSDTWKYARDNQLSAEWQLFGMNFTVPDGVESIQMFIYNDVAQNGSGNDFALDDIEIHLCAPPVTIEGEMEVCENKPTTLTANFTNDGTFAEPLAYKWWHSTDSITWTEISGFNGENLLIDAVQKSDSGWYKVAVSGDGNIESVNCRAVSEPFRLRVKECAEELCIDGILLFREDFGGNDPSDPRVGTNPVPGMSYTQATTDVLGSMGGGKYLVTKQGYCNGNGTSQWHLQDDHTYPNDKTRGYLLEIDGRGDNSAFYSTTIEGLCEGSKLTFSAYVANVMTWGMYIGRPGTYAYPRLKFVLADPVTDAELAMYDTGDIPFDSAFIGDNMCWQQSVEWRLVGMNFTVPAGQNSIKLTIYNNATGSNGNDFAIDDIEIRLCAPPVAIEGETEVCTNNPTTLTANFSNDGTFAEPLAYKWWHSTDSITWVEMSDFNGEILAINAVQKADSGWYKVAVSGDGNIESVNCRAMSEPFRLRVNECEPPEPELCIDGVLLFREDFGGNDPSDPRVGTNPVPGMSYTQATNDVFHSMGSGKYIVTKSGYCNGDTTGWSLPGADQSTYRSQWYIQDDHTYPNDYSRGYFMEIDGSGGSQQFYQTEISGLCEGIELIFSAYVANVFTWFQYDWYTRNRGPVIAPCLKFVLTNPQTGETLVEKNTQQIPFAEELAAKTDWQYSSPWYLVGMNFIVPTGIPAIRLTIYNNVTNGNGNDFALDDIEIRLCMTPDTVRTDTTVCDTLQQITWRGKKFVIADTLRDTLPSSCGFDSIYYELRVATKHCEPPCPELITITADTTVCDTLMPYRWRDTLFTEPATYEILYKDQRGCDSLLCILTLNTQVCCPKMVTITVDTVVCDTLMPYRWRDTLFTEPATYEILYKDQRGCDSLLRVLTLNAQICCQKMVTITVDTVVCDTLMPYRWRDTLFTEPATYEILYKDQRGCDSLLCVLTLNTQICCPKAVIITVDTVVCDTLMPYRWRDTLFTEPATYEILYKDQLGCDSLLRVLTLNTQICCPEMVTITADTTVCDTLLPFTWTLRNQTFVFEHAEIQVLDIPHPKWTDCTDTSYILHLDTFHCEKLWPLIVNKYNWVLLLDNVTLARFFPQNVARAYQWYKNDAPIPGANDDDYSEQNELCGRFQLRIVLDNEQAIWSNILEIGEAQEELPVRVTIFNSWGMLVRENQVSHGVYLYRYEQGEKKWTEKKLIP